MTLKFAGSPRTVAALLAGLLLAAPRLADAQSALGSWAGLERLPVAMTHTMLLSDGKVLFWGEFADGVNPYLWDPQTDTLQKLAAAPSFNMFCGGHVLLPDGRLFEAGGYAAAPALGAPTAGLPNATIFDMTGMTFLDQPKMNGARQCPTAIGLPNGDVLVLSGAETAGSPTVPTVINPLEQVFELSTMKWRDLTGAIVAPSILPRAFVAPDGQIFIAGTAPKSVWMDTSGVGFSRAGPITTLATERSYGGAVMYDAGKIMLVGGGVVPTATAETIDLNSPSPVWTAVASMSTPRRQHNTTVLPDGSVLITGGTQSGALFNDPTGSVPAAELWDPAKNTWTTLAAAGAYRGYDSTALLLPDGRVLTGGGRATGGLSYQIFSPPNLSASRPTIADAPEQVWPSAQFFVNSPEAANIAKVSLIRLGSVTHSWDMGQRYIPLTFTTDGANGLGLVVTGPKDNNIAPAGSYMLFLVDGNGAPSVAKIVDVVYGPTAGPAPALQVPPPETPAAPPPAKSSKAKGGCSAAGGGLLPLPGLLALAALLMLRRRVKAQARMS